MADIVPYPFHLGITEAGTAKSGSIRSSISLGMLLYEGIGDTIRVSLSDDSREEVYTGFEILKALELRKEGTVLVACPSCGRADVDVVKLANSVDDMLKTIKTPVKVAVMGCEVNGPGEAKDADVGIAAGAGRAIIFRKGKKSRIVDEADMLTALMDESGAGGGGDRRRTGLTRPALPICHFERSRENLKRGWPVSSFRRPSRNPGAGDVDSHQGRTD